MMGYNTTVVVMNDALHHIRDDRDFGRNLAGAIMDTSVRDGLIDVPAQSHCNAATAAKDIEEMMRPKGYAPRPPRKDPTP